MLSKPGESRAKSKGAPSSTPSQRRRKAAQESPEEIVRKLQRLPCNKVCADCSSKLPQCVNVTHGSFICLPCSGVHREFSHKIKGLTSSSFTVAEVSLLRSGGNEAVNATYLAKYDQTKGSGRGVSRVRMPVDNSDLNALRVWIRSKYVDKIWFQEGEVGVGSLTNSGNKKNIVQQKTSPEAPQQDLFGGGGDWDAFGDVNTQFQADAGALQNRDELFQADFGGHPTMVNLPPSQPPQQQSTLQQQQQPFEANFANFEESNFDQSNTNEVGLPNEGGQASNMQLLQQPMFHANFDQASIAASTLTHQPMFNAAMNQGVNDFGNAAPQKSAGEMNFDNLSQQPPEFNPNPNSLPISQNTTQQVHANQSFMNVTDLSESGLAPQQISSSNNSNSTTNPPSPNVSHLNPTAHQHENRLTGINPNAFRSVDENRMSAFDDAFDGLSLEPSTGLMVESSVAGGNDVTYSKDSDGISLSKDVAQTAKVQETVMMLQNLSVEQLLQVQQFIGSLGSIKLTKTNDSSGSISNQALGGAINFNEETCYGMTQAQPTEMVLDMRIRDDKSITPASFQDISMTVVGSMNVGNQQQPSTVGGAGLMQMTERGPNIPSNNISGPSLDYSSAPNAISLPPVEKEGNPFDMY